MVVEVMMDLIQPTIMQHMIDTGIANGDHPYVIKMFILMMISAGHWACWWSGLYHL